MLNLIRSRSLSIFWLLVPTLLWSLLLLSPVICIDPFLFPLTERKLKPIFVYLLRTIWAILFAISLLLLWNIGPDTYLFYLAEALPFAPKFVLSMIFIGTLLLGWFVSWKNSSASFGASREWLFFAGIALLLIKNVVAADLVKFPFIKQTLKSPIMASVRSMVTESNIDPKPANDETPDNTFYAHLTQQKSLSPQVVMMLVESWGEKSDALAEMAKAISMQGFHVIKYGLTTYHGSTLSGEFRELCGRYVLPSNALLKEMENLKCAPQYMAERGYEAIGVHGYAKSFYARNAFWQRFGMQKQVFSDGLPGLPRCPGPFNGICDENLIAYGIDLLDAARRPTFLYMLTLSSHEPIDPASLTAHGRYFNDIPVSHQSQIITRRAISTLVERMQSRRSASCTLVYIAGDHQPPSASAKGGIFETGKVPYIVFSRNCL